MILEVGIVLLFIWAIHGIIKGFYWLWRDTIHYEKVSGPRPGGATALTEFREETLGGIYGQMVDLVWHFKMFTITKGWVDDETGETGTDSESLVSLAELLQMDEVPEAEKEAGVRKFLTMVRNEMPPDQAAQVLDIIRQKLANGKLVIAKGPGPKILAPYRPNPA